MLRPLPLVTALVAAAVLSGCSGSGAAPAAPGGRDASPSSSAPAAAEGGGSGGALDLAATSGRTVLAALHTLDLAVQYAAHVLVLDAGRVVAAGPPAAMFTPHLLAAVFGVRGRMHRDADGAEHLLLSSP